MKLSILIAAFCFCLTSAFSQPTFKFKMELDGYGKDDQINDVAVDVNGNMYVAGWIKNAGGEYDYLVAKFDRNGVQKWLQTYDNGNNDLAKSISVQGAYLFITGKSQSGTDYDIATFVIDTGGTTRWEALTGQEEIVASNPTAYDDGQRVATRPTRSLALGDTSR